MKNVVMGAALVAVVFGCGSQPVDAPPEVRYGESVCAECNMILSDERFATATVIEGARGPEPRLFDDFNCQANHERTLTEPVLARWVHDYETNAWLAAESAFYLKSPGLNTPMASGIAAFTMKDGAERVREEVGGEVSAFAELWPERGGGS